MELKTYLPGVAVAFIVICLLVGAWQNGFMNGNNSGRLSMMEQVKGCAQFYERHNDTLAASRCCTLNSPDERLEDGQNICWGPYALVDYRSTGSEGQHPYPYTMFLG